MHRIFAVTPHHHHTVLVHGATLICTIMHSMCTIIHSAMVVRCGGLNTIKIMMIMIHHVMVHLQHIQIHLYVI